jgi:hypothetical protein
VLRCNHIISQGFEAIVNTKKGSTVSLYLKLQAQNKTTNYSSDWFSGGISLHHFLRPEMMARVSERRLKQSGG